MDTLIGTQATETIQPPNAIDTLGESIQGLAGMTDNLQGVTRRAHDSLLGEYNYVPEPSNTPDSPEPEGKLAELTRQVELIRRITEDTLRLAEALDNQT